jgi:hypothetical protein
MFFTSPSASLGALSSDGLPLNKKEKLPKNDANIRSLHLILFTE